MFVLLVGEEVGVCGLGLVEISREGLKLRVKTELERFEFTKLFQVAVILLIQLSYLLIQCLFQLSLT